MEITKEIVQEKILEILKGSGWDEKLRYWWIDTDMLNILQTLIDNSKKGKNWVPGVKKMFRWMVETPYDNVRAVILTDDCAAFIDYNTGIPIHREVAIREGGKEIKLKPSKLGQDVQWSVGAPTKAGEFDLLRWCLQGVLMFPLSPTATIDGIKHYDLWKPMIPRIIEQINKRGDIPIILLGRRAFEYNGFFTSEHIREVGIRPIRDRKWSQWANDILQQKGQEIIDWKGSPTKIKPPIKKNYHKIAALTNGPIKE